MLGNWAMGRRSIETRPTMTVTMEITIATMGRFIKNSDMVSALKAQTIAQSRLAVFIQSASPVLHREPSKFHPSLLDHPPSTLL